MALLIDTNVIIRYLVGDHAALLEKAVELFTQVSSRKRGNRGYYFR